MSERIYRFIKFAVERFLIQGPFYQILFIGGVIGLFSLFFGQLLIWADPAETNLAKNAWWAFLRMSDPGYLGDDNGTYRRILSTILTILGYVLFMGSLVAIMTQWLYKTMKELEAGYTPINYRGHITILGYTNRTPIIIGQILASKDSLSRFLKKIRRSGPTLAILNDVVGYELTADLKTNLPKATDINRVIFRTGDSIDSEDLGRVNVEHSAVVIIPARSFSTNRGFNSDASMVKSLLSIKNRAETAGVKPPKVVAEVLDDGLKNTVKRVYGDGLEVVSSRSLVARMISQNIHNPGLSHVYSELMSQDYGSEIYFKAFPQLVGMEWSLVGQKFENCIPIGTVHEGIHKSINISPKKDEKINNGESIIVIAKSFDEIKISDRTKKNLTEPFPAEVFKMEQARPAKKLLILGWSEKAVYVVNELIKSESLDFSIDILSIHGVEERETALSESIDQKNLSKVFNHQLDYTQLETFEKIDISSYDNILFMTNDWIQSVGEADARSILGVLQLRSREADTGRLEAPVLIELSDPENEKLFHKRPGETIISPIVVSAIIANIALRPELSMVFDVLFDSNGADISFRSASSLMIEERMTFGEIKQKLQLLKEVPIGLRCRKDDKCFLNPAFNETFASLESYDLILLG